MGTMVQMSELGSAVRGARFVPGRDAGDATITDLTYDSRMARAGTLFCCVPGLKIDGHVFASVAIASGAVGLVVERELDVAVPQLVVSSVRAAMGPLASRFFGEPSRALTLVGVTGTNGKTTTTFLLESVARSLGRMPGIIGTVETHVGDAVEPVTRTTPESIDLQRLLARMRDSGVEFCAMEVSSHGLDLGRVDGCTFAASVFTNLSQDHLDYHADMDDYFEAKALLFDAARSAAAVVNLDDPYGQRLATRVTIPLVTFGIDRAGATVRAASIRMDATGSNVAVETPSGRLEVRVPLAARYNVENALGVVGVAVALGWDLDRVVTGIASTGGVPGRLEAIDAGQAFTVLVDYAHTPDSLRGVLSAAREVTPSSALLWVVFGCGGDRDRTKRPIMGEAGASLADRCIITSDNPRTEDPDAIVEEIAAGARTTRRPFETIVDRREAISHALGSAAAGDVVVIAGKGHESGQEFADHTIAFDDRVVAREILEELACSR